MARHYEDILLDYRFIRAIVVQLNLKSEQNIHFRLLSICRKFPGFDSRFYQIQEVHLKFIAKGLRLDLLESTEIKHALAKGENVIYNQLYLKKNIIIDLLVTKPKTLYSQSIPKSQ